MKTVVVFEGVTSSIRVLCEAEPWVVEKAVDDWRLGVTLPSQLRGDPQTVALHFIDYAPESAMIRGHGPNMTGEQTITIRCRAGEGWFITVAHKEA